MAIINKAALKAQFKTGGVPAVQHLFNLIDSVLVKRDDLFFGKWQPGVSYSQGDVVIHGKAFYCCITGEGANPCDEKTGTEYSEALPTTFCSQEQPGLDKVNWQLMFEVPDEDWIIVRGADGSPDVLYAKVFGNIGMGTSSPQARVHIHNDKKGTDFLFDPELNGTPGFIMKRADEGSLTQSLEDSKAVFTTDTEGFLFQKSLAPTTETGEDSGTLPVTSSLTPVFIKIGDDKTAVSIGHILPEAGLDVQGSQGSRVLLGPQAHKIPEVLLWNRAEAGQQFLSEAVSSAAALFTTNAPEGYYLRTTNQEAKSFMEDSGDLGGETIVSIKNDKKVGVGTETPRGELDVKSAGGSMVLDLSSFDNPVLKIINIRPNEEDTNFLAVGANNDYAVLMTDSEFGFVFKKGPNDLTDISRGENLLVISPDKKVGIGIMPKNYELDLYGNARMFSLYLNTDNNKIDIQNNLGDGVLKKLMGLKPIVYRWKEHSTPFSGNQITKNQIGFLPSNVDEYFPELVKKDNDGATIAYANMVAVLTKAVQEQQTKIMELEERLKKLEAASYKK